MYKINISVNGEQSDFYNLYILGCTYKIYQHLYFIIYIYGYIYFAIYLLYQVVYFFLHNHMFF